MSDDVETTVVQVSIDGALLAKINAMAERERAVDEAKPNRSRTVRRLLRRGIEAEEKGAAAQ